MQVRTLPPRYTRHGKVKHALQLNVMHLLGNLRAAFTKQCLMQESSEDEDNEEEHRPTKSSKRSKRHW